MFLVMFKFFPLYSEVEVGDGVGDLGAGIGEPFEMFEKEDMSDMFRRAMLEKMQLVGMFCYEMLPCFVLCGHSDLRSQILIFQMTLRPNTSAVSAPS